MTANQPPFPAAPNSIDDSLPDGQELIARLQQKIEGQEYKLQQQTRRIELLERIVADTQAAAPPPVDVPDLFTRIKTEIMQNIEHQYGRRLREVDPAANLAAQVDTHTKTLHQLLRDVEKSQRFDEQITLARTEVERLNRSVSTFQVQIDALNKQLTERSRSATYLEDQRRHDTRHITELQADLPNLNKKIEAAQNKIKLVEQQIPQFGKYEMALEELRNEIRRAREHTDFQLAERERQMKKWSTVAESQEKRLEDYKALMEKYAEHYQLNKRALASLQDFQERLQREQHQALELQRLAEDRQWSNIQRWQNDYEQRWKKQSSEWQPPVTNLQKNIDLQQKQIDRQAKINQTLEQQIELLLQIIEEDILTRTQAATTWQQRFEELAN
jgi:chromosome segregation ATPase